MAPAGRDGLGVVPAADRGARLAVILGHGVGASVIVSLAPAGDVVAAGDVVSSIALGDMVEAAGASVSPTAVGDIVAAGATVSSIARGASGIDAEGAGVVAFLASISVVGVGVVAVYSAHAWGCFQAMTREK